MEKILPSQVFLSIIRIRSGVSYKKYFRQKPMEMTQKILKYFLQSLAPAERIKNKILSPNTLYQESHNLGSDINCAYQESESPGIFTGGPPGPPSGAKPRLQRTHTVWGGGPPPFFQSSQGPLGGESRSKHFLPDLNDRPPTCSYMVWRCLSPNSEAGGS